MAQQTAVNWLIKNLMLNGLIRLTQDQHSLYKELTEQANQMFEEQIIKAHGLKYYDINEETVTGEEYYNENFNTKEK